MLIKQEKNKIFLFKNESFLKSKYISYILKDNNITLRPNLQSRKDEILHRISLYDFLHLINEYHLENLEDKRIIPFLEEMSVDFVQEEIKKIKRIIYLQLLCLYKTLY